MKCFLIMNPGSRGGRSGKRFKKLFALLNKHGLQYDYEITHKLEDARRFSHDINKKAAHDVVVAVGGDGTINAVINGFYDGQGHRISNTAFGVIYTGTSPDFCKSYSIPLNLDLAVQNLKRGTTRAIPIGRIVLSERRPSEGETINSQQTIRYFACCANVGLGASLARRANGGVRKLLGDRAGTFLALLLTLIRYKPNAFVRTVDGKKEVVDTLYNASIGITPYIASGIRVPEDRRMGGNMVYCMTVAGLKMKEVIPLLKQVYSGKPFGNSSYLQLSWCREMVVERNMENPEVEFDGDPAGFLPCSIRIARDKLELLCS